jgi:hypothetical protein
VCRPAHAQALNQLTGVAVIFILTRGAACLLLPWLANAAPNGCASGLALAGRDRRGLTDHG